MVSLGLAAFAAAAVHFVNAVAVVLLLPHWLPDAVGKAVLCALVWLVLGFGSSYFATLPLGVAVAAVAASVGSQVRSAL